MVSQLPDTGEKFPIGVFESTGNEMVTELGFLTVRVRVADSVPIGWKPKSISVGLTSRFTGNPFAVMSKV